MDDSLLGDGGDKSKRRRATQDLFEHDDSDRQNHLSKEHFVHHHSSEDKKRFFSFEALDYDIVENKVFKIWRDTRSKIFKLMSNFGGWFIYFEIGFITGLLAFAIVFLAELLEEYKFEGSYLLIEEGHYAQSYFRFVGLSVFFCFVASLPVIFIANQAKGSGIPEVKSYLNGTNIPRVFELKTIISKLVGLIFSICGGLACDPEGPMVHTGASVAAYCSHMPKLPRLFNSPSLKCYRNDHDKRDFVSAGSACGVAAAFGAPVGGVLFSLEEASSFWSMPLTWRVFFCAMTSTFTYKLFKLIQQGGGYLNNPGLIGLGGFPEDGYLLWELFIFVLMGIGGGIIGALFIKINIYLAKIRKLKLHKYKIICVIEVIIISFIGSTLQFWIPYAFSCHQIPENPDQFARYVRYQCGEDEYNSMASLIFTPFEQSTKALIHNTGQFELSVLLIFFVFIFSYCVIVCGMNVAGGIFAPVLLIGATYGRLCAYIAHKFNYEFISGVYAFIGSTACLGGVTRMTISLTVILLEATNDLQYLLPIMLVIMVSKWVGDAFTIALYDHNIELNCYPFVEAAPPLDIKDFEAKDVMQSPVVVFKEIESVFNVFQVLNDTKHNGFPIVNDRNQCVGIILRSQIIVLLTNRLYVPKEKIKQKPYYPENHINYYDFTCTLQSKTLDIDIIRYDPEIMNCYLDFRSFMNPAPYTVQLNWPLSRVYRLYRSMGLRHLPVLNQNNEVMGILTRKELNTDFKTDLT